MLSDNRRDTLFKEHGVRWTELIQLSHFNAVRMTIIDPMHNILPGVVKVFWLSGQIHSNALRKRTRGSATRQLDYFNLWIKFVRSTIFLFFSKLTTVHSSLKCLPWMGRLPTKVGYSAGGSLTAIEYKALILAFLPIAVCQTC